MPRKKHRLLGISVDWDYFVPEEIEWDLGHCETPFHLSHVWMLRAALESKMRTSGEEAGFWARVFKRLPLAPSCRAAVSESHISAWSILNTMPHIKLVVLFDAHHDCWPRHGKALVTCSDWLRVWLEADRSRRAIWVHPSWIADRDGLLFPLPKGKLREQIKVYSALPPKARLRAEAHALHICRSGCWTPPWLDESFAAFVAGVRLQHRIYLSPEVQVDPLHARWSAADRQQARAFSEQFSEQLGFWKPGGGRQRG